MHIQKQYLLETDLVVDNEYFDKYISLLNSCQQESKIPYETDCHHVIPAFFYRANGLKLNDLPSNKVHLLCKDHVKAHCYLALCVTNKYAVAACNAAHRCITGHEGNFKNIEECISYDTVQKLKVELNKQRSVASKLLRQKKNNSGRVWITNGKKEKLVFPEEVRHFERLGFREGRIPRPEAVEKMRQTRTGQKYSVESARQKRENATATMLERYGVRGINTSTPERNENIRGTLNKYYETHHQASKGKLCIHNISSGQIKYVPKEELDQWLQNGWATGRK